MTKPPCQNIDVKVFQFREPGQWKARILVGEDEFVVGPANIASIMNNVANFIRTEAAYADLKVHGDLPDVPTTARAVRMERRARYNMEAYKSPVVPTVPVPTTGEMQAAYEKYESGAAKCGGVCLD